MHYVVKGRGNRLLFTFHGYGLKPASWAVFEPLLSESYRLIHICLPEHGKSKVTWEDMPSFYKIILQIRKEESVTGTFDLLSYSLGANYALHLMQYIPSEIGAVFLMAPDGFQAFNFKQWIYRRRLGRWIAGGFIRSGIIVKGLIKAAAFLGFVPRKNARYFLDSILRSDQRHALIKRWMAVAALSNDLSSIMGKLKSTDVNIQTLLGSRDEIIKASQFNQVQRELFHVTIGDIGHNMLKKEAIPYLKEWIKSNPLLQNNE